MYKSLQGNLGLGKAIEYFTSHSIPVAIPLNDTQKYDLIADINNKLCRISVKTSGFKLYKDSYCVQLKNCGGASGKSIIRQFDNSTCDYVFIYVADGRIFLIPSDKIQSKNMINVGSVKYGEYEVKSKSFEEFLKCGEVDPSGRGTRS